MSKGNGLFTSENHDEKFLWPGALVPYEIKTGSDNGFKISFDNLKKMTNLYKAMKEIESQSCIR